MKRILENKLLNHLKLNKIASMEDLKIFLSTRYEKTVYRRLLELGYRSSYSHRGTYYSLESKVSFNSQGLWSYNTVLFSKYGTLLNTTKNFIEKSKKGFSSFELGDVLHVETRETLLKLFKWERIYREKISGVYIYFTVKASIRKQQIKLRQEYIKQQEVGLASREMKVLEHELRAAIILFVSFLDEKQKRLYAGLESARFGHGGDQTIAELLRVDPHTVAKGRTELFDEAPLMDKNVRKKGGGRKNIKKSPGCYK